jgi:acyl-coenzyme A synthetase/AMP-(fatty) acid ligase
MRKKMRFAMRRSVTMSNLLESLAAGYDRHSAFLHTDPLGYNRFPQAGFSYGDAILFTSLVAEALIRDFDLKKGERVILMTSNPTELLLLVLAVIKSGGIAVPLDHRLPSPEVRYRAGSCFAELAIIDGRVLGERADLPGNMPKVERLIVSGSREKVPDGFPSLDESMDKSGGFFLPYTLKQGSVTGLFHTSETGGSSMAVMATNQVLLGARRTASLILPCGPDHTCVCALPPTSLCGFSAIAMGLSAGMDFRLLPEGGPERALEALRESGASVFMGDANSYDEMLQAGANEYDLSAVRLWLCAGGGVSQQHIDAFLALGSHRPGKLCRPTLFVEAHDVNESTAMVALWVCFSGPGRTPGSLGFPLPPNRIKVVGEAGRRAKRGEEGELLVKGPAVTPGYWNNLDGFLEIVRNGWLHTGVIARRRWFHYPYPLSNQRRER